MKGPRTPTSPANAIFVLAILLLVTTPSFLHHCLARTESSHDRSPPAPTLPPPLTGSSSTMFNVLHYGAAGHGTTDDTKALAAAWSAACGVTASTVLVPVSHVFLVGPITFTGDSCQSDMVFQVDGTILAPADPKAWRSGDVKQWLEFKNVRGLTIQGSGTVDGQGSHWWTSRSVVDDDVRAEKDAELDDSDRVEANSNRPTALRVFQGANVTVTGITIRNSPKFHLTLDTCRAVDVRGVAVSSPGDSPNTDGIHLTGSVGVSIHKATIACGDDCVSIQDGCSDVSIRGVHCGPGHGISIGGLGKGGAAAVVSDITVEDVTLNRTTNGVRIKTWQNVRFSRVRVAAVQTPVVIDQYYCDQAAPCANRTSAVAVSGVAYRGVAGTYTERPVYLACSDAAPCSGIHLADIRLAPAKNDGEARLRGPFCWKAYGDEVRPVEPPVGCLMAGAP